MATTDNMLSLNTFIDDFSVGGLSRGLCERVKARRLELNLTQPALSKRSGVSLGTIKHFERYGKISLQSLLLLAIILGSIEEFKKLFTNKNYTSLDDIIKMNNNNKRKRGRVNV